MKKSLLAGVILLLVFAVFSSDTEAYEIEKRSDVSIRNDFPIGPTQFEIVVDRGDIITKQIQIDNRKGEKWKFMVEVEDFEGSLENPRENVILRGSESGKYGAKDWVTPEMMEFETDHGDRLFMDVTIKIPENADAGDHYASVLISALPREDDIDEIQGQNIRITSRAGILFFIRVKGAIKEEGKVKSFESDRKWYEKTPVIFRTIFENTGSVRLRPYGSIIIKNMLGESISGVEVVPFNVLRDSTRSMTESFESDSFLIGKYTATLKMNRGYGDIVDEESVSFWIIPWKIILVAIVSLIVFYGILKLIRKKFHLEVKIKKK